MKLHQFYAKAPFILSEIELETLPINSVLKI